MKLSETQLAEVVYTNIGSASMCWSKTPFGKFDDERAGELAREIIEAAKMYAEGCIEEDRKKVLSERAREMIEAAKMYTEGCIEEDRKKVLSERKS